MKTQTQTYSLNLGPQHPSTHGVFRIILELDGEFVVKATPVPGYLHRGIEKLAEARTYTQVIPYTDRMDYLAGMLMNWGYVMSVEKLMSLEIPERAEYIRVIVGELSRIASHMMSVGALGADLGALTAFTYTFRDREYVMDLLEMTSGSRMTFNYMRVGGVVKDFPPEFYPALKHFLSELPGMCDEYDGLLTGNEIFIARTKNIGIITPEMGINYSLSGPTIRGSGVNLDLRKTRPYSIYDRFDFQVPLGENGDCYDRFRLRIEEMRQSGKIIQQALEQIEEGPIMAKVPKIIKPPVGDVYTEIESSKGIYGSYLVSDGSTKPYRIHFRRPSFINLGYLGDLCKGWKLADVIAILGSIDIVLGEVDC
ncbi:MAG: NADH-quinone oxidoreductase subunit D [Peptococcaceae bacterium]|nr:NADH-quinone oxidoreductase subunit D [Peptococcaceae bacterium]